VPDRGSVGLKRPTLPVAAEEESVEMGRDAIKLLLAAGLLLFAVMFGMELASSGISSVYGPADPALGTVGRQHADSPSRAGVPYGGQASEAEGADEPEAGWYGSEPDGISVNGAGDPRIPRLDHKPVVDRIASGAAGLLQSVSKEGIHLIAKLFGKTTE